LKRRDLQLKFDSEDEYYEYLFVKNKKWSQKEPNKDESLRLEKINELLNEVKKDWKENKISSPAIIDFGCGRGWLTNSLSFLGTVTGIDPVEPVIKYARKLFPNLNFECGSFEKLAMHKVELIVSSEVIEHLSEEQKDLFLRTSFESLKPNGYLLITTPRAEAYQEWCKNNTSQQPLEEWITEERMHQLFENNRFKIKNKIRLNDHLYKGEGQLELYQLWLVQKIKL
jgi:2-polyprenyl-3-methyl-5-hydroxy-6-metoxy-1,4-benzoquinol methylase